MRTDIMLVCLNGHKINDRFKTCPDKNLKYCNICGKETIIRCEHCNSYIQGKQLDQFVQTSSTPLLKSYCHNCGEPYPWTTIDKASKDKAEDFEFNQIGIDVVFNKLHTVAKQLLIRYNDRETIKINDEYDVQDLMYSLLKMYYLDIRAEEWNPSYAGRSTRSDFLLKNEEIVIEVKKTNKNLKDKKIGEQLIIDIEKYQAHPNCKKLYCFIYDPEEFIINPAGLIGDLEKPKREIEVKIIIKPER